METTDTRPAALAGTWYSASPQILRSQVESFLQKAPAPTLSEEIIALFAPHAGHRYSGPVAGYAYRAVQGNSYDTVAVISPYHQGSPHPLLTTSHDSYATPLGKVAVDCGTLAKLDDWLRTNVGEVLKPVRQDQEHAIEIELPFLQVALAGGFQLLPIMISGGHPDTAGVLGQALAAVLKEKPTLLVASTDLSHFYPAAEANRLDQAMLEAIASFDPAQVLQVQHSGKGQACGLLAVLAVMSAARQLGATQAHVFKYATSGSTSGDYSRVVGYGAGGFTRPARTP